MNDYADKIMFTKKIIKRYVGDERLIFVQAIDDFKQLESRRFEVTTVKQARNVLLSQDLRELLGLKKQLNVFFESIIKQDITVNMVAVMPNKVQQVITNYQSQGWTVHRKEEKLGRTLIEMYKSNGQIKSYFTYVETKNQYLYKTIDAEKNEISSYNIIDLYEIIMKVDYYKAIEELCEIYHIKVTEIEKERALYARNRETINNIFDNKEYLTVRKELSDLKDLLKQLINFGEETLYSRSSKKVQYDHIRYISISRYDLEYLVNKLRKPITVDQAKRKIKKLAELEFITFTSNNTSYPLILYFCEYNEVFLKALMMRLERA